MTASRLARRRRIVVAVLIVLGALIGAASALAAVIPKPDGGRSGTFTFGKAVSGTVAEPNKWTVGSFTSPSCRKTVDPGEFNITFYNLKLELNGRKVVMTGGDSTLPIFLFVSVKHYGDTESVANSTGDPVNAEYAASSGINLTLGRAQYGWITNAASPSVNSSGTVTTNAAGTKGSLNVTMVPVGTGETSGLTTKARGLLTVKGFWSSCAKSLPSP